MSYVNYDKEYVYPISIKTDEFGYEHEIIIKFPKDWFEKFIKEESTFDSIEDFFDNYISDDTEEIYCAALIEGVIEPIEYFCYEDGELEIDIKKTLSKSVSDDYVNDIFEEIKDNIIDDVLTSSAWIDEGFYNEDDIKLAIGRVLMNELGINRD